MSGPLANHRPGSKPMIFEGMPVMQARRRIRPGGVHKDGRCVEWIEYTQMVPVCVLDYAKPADRPSKHARGRIRPRTKAERTRMAGIRRRAVQARKSMTIDINRYAAMFDEVAV